MTHSPTNLRPRGSRRLLGPIALATVLLGAACGGPPARGPNPTKPLDERRAQQIIADVFRSERTPAVAGRKLQVAEGKLLEVDIGASANKYGVAYVTGSERADLGNALPQPAPGQEESLQLVRGAGADADARVLVLYDTAYKYDDQVGTEHEETVLTAERKLARDVRDFLVQARAQRWP